MILTEQDIKTILDENHVVITESEMLRGLFAMTGSMEYAIREYNRIMELDNE